MSINTLNFQKIFHHIVKRVRFTQKSNKKKQFIAYK